jgi:hypothetical protein
VTALTVISMAMIALLDSCYRPSVVVAQGRLVPRCAQPATSLVASGSAPSKHRNVAADTIYAENGQVGAQAGHQARVYADAIRRPLGPPGTGRATPSWLAAWSVLLLPLAGGSEALPHRPDEPFDKRRDRLPRKPRQ